MSAIHQSTLRFVHRANEMTTDIKARRSPKQSDIVIEFAFEGGFIHQNQSPPSRLATEVKTIGSEPMLARVHMTSSISAIANQISDVAPAKFRLRNLIGKCHASPVCSEFSQQVVKTYQALRDCRFKERISHIFKDTTGEDRFDFIDVAGQNCFPKKLRDFIRWSCHA